MALTPTDGMSPASGPPPHVDDPVDHATLMLDAEQRILAVSSSVIHFFQAAVSDVLGRPVADFLPTLRLLAEFRDRRYPAGEHARLRLSREHTVACRPDGTELPVTVSLFETKEEGHILLWLRHMHAEGEYCPVPTHELLRAEGPQS